MVLFSLEKVDVSPERSKKTLVHQLSFFAFALFLLPFSEAPEIRISFTPSRKKKLLIVRSVLAKFVPR